MRKPGCTCETYVLRAAGCVCHDLRCGDCVVMEVFQVRCPVLQQLSHQAIRDLKTMIMYLVSCLHAALPGFYAFEIVPASLCWDHETLTAASKA